MIRILVDSSSDYPLEELAQKHIEEVPITISIGEDNYIEGVNLERNDFYQLLEKSTVFPKTSQPSPQTFLDIFEDVKAKGDEIICILLSSKLSGTYQSAMLAKEMADYDQIYLIDSLSATCNIKVMADYACQLVQEGKSAQKIVEAVEELKPRVKVIAMLDTLEYLYRGGRLSKTTAAIGEFANVKPVITLTEDGEIGILGKCLGKTKAMNFMMKHIEKLAIDERFPIYSIYTYGLENTEKFENKLINAHYQPNNRLQIGPTIGAHIGQGAFGLIYVIK